MSEKKILTYDQTIPLVEHWHRQGERIVFTNGCFDIVHLGHVDCLEKARQYGDKLIVAVNTDESVARIKGSHRPIIDEYSRARHLAAFEFVDLVLLFNQPTPLALIEAIRPHVLVKGGDYTVGTIVGADFVIQNGGIVRTIPLLEGYSTTAIIEWIQKGCVQ